MARKASAKRTRARPAAEAADPEFAAIEAALRLAAERGWSELTLAEIAAEAGQPLSEFYRRFPTRQAILAALSRRVDLQVLQAIDGEPPEGDPRDRLFDVVMRRFDALQPHRAGLRAVARASCRDPLALLCGAAGLRRSMAAMLEAAGISATGLAGLIRAKGLAAVYLAAFRAWLRDETEDRAHTMAALDRALRRAEGWASVLERPLGCPMGRRRATA